VRYLLDASARAELHAYEPRVLQLICFREHDHVRRRPGRTAVRQTQARVAFDPRRQAQRQRSHARNVSIDRRCQHLEQRIAESALPLEPRDRRAQLLQIREHAATVRAELGVRRYTLGLSRTWIGDQRRKLSTDRRIARELRSGP
jgi:hypothetical protein